MYFFSLLGDSQYVPPDDDISNSSGNEKSSSIWPMNPDIWYANMMLSAITNNVIYALFCEGILNICAKLANPLSLDATSFSERAYGKSAIIIYISNNVTYYMLICYSCYCV